MRALRAACDDDALLAAQLTLRLGKRSDDPNRQEYFETSVNHTDANWLRRFAVGTRLIMFGLWWRGKRSETSKPHARDATRMMTYVTHKLSLTRCPRGSWSPLAEIAAAGATGVTPRAKAIGAPYARHPRPWRQENVLHQRYCRAYPWEENLAACFNHRKAHTA